MSGTLIIFITKKAQQKGELTYLSVKKSSDNNWSNKM